MQQKGMTTMLIPLPDTPHPEGIDRLLGATFGLRDRRELQSYEQEVYDRYSNPDELRRLMMCLDRRLITVLVLRYGLIDNNPVGQKIVGRSFGVTKELICQLEARAIARLRWAARQYLIVNEETTSVSSLFDPSSATEVRVANTLRRNGIHTVGALALKTEADLLGITNFRLISLARVKTRLGEHGLSLASQ